MSDSGLTLPTRTEAEYRIEKALKVARENEAHIGRVGWNDHTAGLGLGALQKIIAILEGK